MLYMGFNGWVKHNFLLPKEHKVLNENLIPPLIFPQTLSNDIKLIDSNGPFHSIVYCDENSLSSELSTAILPLHYLKADDLMAILHSQTFHWSSKNGSFLIDQRSNRIMVQDLPENLIQIKKMIAALDVPIQQILLEARIVNIDTDKEQDLGLSFNFTADESSTSTNTPINSGLNNNNLGVAIVKLNSTTLLDLKLAALTKQGHGEIIAKPRLMTVEQQTAVIESGEEIPYQETAGEGATQVAFKKAVLSLRVTPKIVGQQKILLDLKVNQDSRGSMIVNGVPTINTQQITSQVLVGNGQTLVLGGIYEQVNNDQLERIPFLSDLPLIGGLLQNKHHLVTQRELLIFVTPRIVG